ncbi:hypothetical protein ACFZB9_19125 [Kitasatospora sp. NPDC008050]|uniref:hypothetical protein n=1 Tax=Kitasatospora sp. NPDC008050 TaxID=3364021 RepID=UPI0036EBF202
MDWALVTAAGLGRTLPRIAALALARHERCPAGPLGGPDPVAVPAVTVACCTGQESTFHTYRQEPGGGRQALHEAALDFLDRALAADPPAGFWAEVGVLFRSFPGTLPELLAAAADRAGR